MTLYIENFLKKKLNINYTLLCYRRKRAERKYYEMRKYDKVMEDRRKEILAKHVRDSRNTYECYAEHCGELSDIAIRQWIIYSTYEKLYVELYHETVKLPLTYRQYGEKGN